MEHSYFQGLLRKHGGDVMHCAEEAGVACSAFQNVMQRYGMKSSDYRECARERAAPALTARRAPLVHFR